MSERLTNDYAALVAMLDQAAADLQAEIDAAIDRHGLLVRTADQLRAEAAERTLDGCDYYCWLGMRADAL